MGPDGPAAAPPGAASRRPATRVPPAPPAPAPPAPAPPAPGSPVGGGGGGAAVVTSPLNLPPFQIVGAPYSGQVGAVEERIRGACGGSLCVTYSHEFDGSADPQTLDCTVTAIRQPDPLDRGDHVVFELGNPCGPEDTASLPSGNGDDDVDAQPSGTDQDGGAGADGDGS